MRSHGYSPPPSTPPSNLLSARFRLDDLPQTILVVPPLRLAPSSSIERKRERERDRSEAIGSATKSEKKSTKKEQQEGSGEQVQFASRFNVANYGEQSQARSYSFQSSRVTYGGVNGTYYTSSTTRRSGNVGLSYLREGQANASSSPICIPSITSSLNTLTHANCNCKCSRSLEIQ